MVPRDPKPGRAAIRRFAGRANRQAWLLAAGPRRAIRESRAAGEVDLRSLPSATHNPFAACGRWPRVVVRLPATGAAHNRPAAPAAGRAMPTDRAATMLA